MSGMNLKMLYRIIIIIKYMLYGYRLWHVHMMDVCMNTFILTNYINASVRVAIEAKCPWCIVLSAESFLSMFPTIDWDLYMLM